MSTGTHQFQREANTGHKYGHQTVGISSSSSLKYTGGHDTVGKPTKMVKIPSENLWGLFMRNLTTEQENEIKALICSYPDKLGVLTGDDIVITEEHAATLARLGEALEPTVAPLGGYEPWMEENWERWNTFMQATGEDISLEDFSLMYVYSRPVFDARRGAHVGVKERDACQQATDRIESRNAYRITEENGDTSMDDTDAENDQ